MYEDKYIDVIESPGSDKTYNAVGIAPLVTSDGINQSYMINTKKDHEMVFGKRKVKTHKQRKIDKEYKQYANTLEKMLNILDKMV